MNKNKTKLKQTKAKKKKNWLISQHVLNRKILYLMKQPEKNKE